MKNDEELFAELLDRWESAVEAGLPITVEEVCRDCPESVDAFRVLLTKLGAVNAVLKDTEPAEGTAELAGPEDGGRYRVSCFHDRGGQAVVFAAEDTELRRTVALKWMPPLSALDVGDRNRFVREAELMARLEHPGIVPVYGLGRDENGQPYYAMRMIQGTNLGDLAKSFHAKRHETPFEHNLEFRDLLQYFISVCATVAYAHARNILHRDLKPNNIRIGPFRETLVLDWGLAKSLDPDIPCDDLGKSPPETETLPFGSGNDGRWTMPGDVMGTPVFMSPEQARGDGEAIGKSADIYSLGATLYVLLCGKAPYRGDTTREILDQVKLGNFPPPRTIKPAIPRALDAVCRKAMSLNPADRYASVQQLSGEIENWLADEPVIAWPDPWYVRARRWVARHRTLTVSSATALLIAVIGLSGFTILLERKNRELEQANAVAEANFQQSHASLRRIVDFIVNGRTLGNNAFLLPIRREALQVAVENAENLLSRDPTRESLRAELAALLSLQSQWEAFYDTRVTQKLLNRALTLCGTATSSESKDVTLTRAAARYLLAEFEKSRESADRLLEASCKDLSGLIEQDKEGKFANPVGPVYQPEVLLAHCMTALESFPPERNHWISVAESRLRVPRESDPKYERIAQSARGQVWYSEARREILKNGNPTAAREAVDRALEAYTRAVKAVGPDDLDFDVRWMFAEAEALSAEILVLQERFDEALMKLQHACDELAAIVGRMESSGALLTNAWQAFDKRRLAHDESQNTNPTTTTQLQLRIVHHHLTLADLKLRLKKNAQPDIDTASRALREATKGDKGPESQQREVANLAIGLAHLLARVDADKGEVRFWAESGCSVLAKSVNAPNGTIEDAFSLCKAYMILGEIASTADESLKWLSQTEMLQDRLKGREVPVAGRQLAVLSSTMLASAACRQTPPRWEPAWNASRRAVEIVDSLLINTPTVSPDIARAAVNELARASMGWSGELLELKPVPREKVTRICEPACEAMEMLQRRGIKLNLDEQRRLHLLNSVRKGEFSNN